MTHDQMDGNFYLRYGTDFSNTIENLLHISIL